MDSKKKHTTITSWADEDQPRTKLLLRGREGLTDAELLAILLRSGSRDESALQLAKKILGSVNNNLHELGKLSISDLTKFKGVGSTKAITIISALEMGRRRGATLPTKKSQITSSHDAYMELKHRISDLDHEQFWILLLNQANGVIDLKRISIGGIASTIVDARIIFKHAIDVLASGIILCHNHPSGNLTPSKADIDITKKLMEGAKQLDIKILDHLIISEKGYCSLKDEGLI